jgi:LacI family transcriptional regulator
MPVRMKDIARDCGVSVVTVSKVLRNHADISEETRERVLKRMRELNYQPNLAARALVTGRTSTIGLVAPDLTHPFFAEVGKGISGVLRQSGYVLMIASSEEDAELEKQELNQLMARGVDALIIASAQWTVESFRRIEERGTPYVLIDRQFAGLSANFVGVDDVAVGLAATEHLFEAGCRRIAHIRGGDVSTATGRLEGYRTALLRHGLAPRADYLVGGASSDDRGEVSGRRWMRQLLDLEPRPDAVFCFNDPVAMGAMGAVLDAGLRIPEDIAIAGCGNVNYGAFLRVGLTSVDQNAAEIGTRAAELALKLIEAKSPPRPVVLLSEPRVVVRASSRRGA